MRSMAAARGRPKNALRSISLLYAEKVNGILQTCADLWAGRVPETSFGKRRSKSDWASHDAFKYACCPLLARADLLADGIEGWLDAFWSVAQAEPSRRSIHSHAMPETLEG